ncbi:MAG: hypothetical protein ABSA92_11845 [Candidatus Bathyarchaeia archaeon]
MPLCLVALVLFSIMSIGSTKYRSLARETFKCVTKTLTLSPCDMAFEQRIKAQVTAKLLKVYPPLARAFYWNFKVFAWAFTVIFFVSLIYTAYSFYNFAVYGSCEPGGVCYLTWIGGCILNVERVAVYLALATIIGIAYFLIRRVRR